MCGDVAMKRHGNGAVICRVRSDTVRDTVPTKLQHNQEQPSCDAAQRSNPAATRHRAPTLEHTTQPSRRPAASNPDRTPGSRERGQHPARHPASGADSVELGTLGAPPSARNMAHFAGCAMAGTTGGTDPFAGQDKAHHGIGQIGDNRQLG